MLFNCRLRDIGAIAPWHSASWGRERPTLDWPGLSAGWYWLEVGGHELFRYSVASLQREEPWHASSAALPYAVGTIAMHWGDMLEQLPPLLAPLPSALAERVADADAWRAWQERAARWQERQDGAAARATYQWACGWWGDYRLTSDYLTADSPCRGPQLWCWRAQDIVHLRWDNREVLLRGQPLWAAEVGEYALPTHAFLDEIRAFNTRFVAAMGERVAAVSAHWPRPEVALDRDRLGRHQREQAAWFTGRIARISQAVADDAAAVLTDDWRAVLAAIARIERDSTP